MLAIGLLYPAFKLFEVSQTWDPYSLRFGISTLFLGLLIATFISHRAAQMSSILLSIGIWILTFHFYSLIYHNPGVPDFLAGSASLVILASCVQYHRLLIPYFICVTTLSILISLTQPGISAPVLMGLTLSGCFLAAVTLGAQSNAMSELYQTRDLLELAVQNRTQELSNTNESLAEQLRFSHALNRIAEQIAANDSQEPIFRSLARISGEALEADYSLILFVEWNTGRAKILSQWSKSQTPISHESAAKFKAPKTWAYLSKSSQSPTILTSYANARDPRLVADGIDTIIHDDFRVMCFLCSSFAPSKTGCHLGVITRAEYEDPWSNASPEFMRAASSHVQIALQKMDLRNEWHRAQEALIKSEQQLRQAQKMEALGRLAGGIAHDFNNLLTAISGYGEIIRGNLADEDPNRRDIEEVLYASNRAASLVEQLLAFSRQERQFTQIVDINQLITRLNNMIVRLIGDQIEVRSELASEELRIVADPGQLEQVLINLAVNAKDAMPDGGILRLKTSLLESSRDRNSLAHLGNPTPCVRIEVSDTGVGMDPQTKARIFEPFFTTKDVDKGTGLGLSTAYGIVTQSGGSIRVVSALGKGSTFVLDFPKALEEKPLEPQPPIRTDPNLVGGSETILLVEDEDSVRKLTSRILRKNGHEVLEANSGRDAISCFMENRNRITLVISDVVMPGMSGPEMATTLRAEVPELKILFMSGYADSTFRKGSGLSSNSASIQKPFSPDEMFSAIRSLLGPPHASGEPMEKGVS